MLCDMEDNIQFLPIGSDLSMASLRWALELGDERKLGRAFKLSVSPEIYFIARSLLAIPPGAIGLEKEKYLILEQSVELNQHSWQVHFEHGIIRSNAIWNEL